MSQNDSATGNLSLQESSERNSSQHSGSVCVSSYIVGCLMSAGIININLDDPLAGGEMLSAMRIVNKCITDMGLWKSGQGMPNQPFWPEPKA